MSRTPLLILPILVASVAGCAMVSAWKTIPPPGGCSQCHTVAISADWTVAYKAPVLTDERNRNYFQTEKYSMPQSSRPASSLDIRKVEDLPCFECHKSPNVAHKGRMGHYHH